MKSLFLSFLLVLGTTAGALAQTACEFWGEVSTEVIARGSFAACTRSANPLVCKTALAMMACADNPSCNGVFQKVNENGCEIVLTAVNGTIRITAAAKQESYNYLQQAYNELHRQITNLYWRQSF